MSNTFKSSGEYFKQVAAKSSDPLQWKSVWICLAREISNDVTFTHAKRSSLTVDLSGTKRHLTEMDGKRDDRATRPGDVCQIPVGAQARFAWETLGPEQQSIMLEISDGFFSIHSPELVSGEFLSGHLQPQNYKPNPEIASLVRLLAREIEHGKGRGALFAESAIRMLAIEIASSCWTHKPLKLRAETTADWRIKKALDFIEGHFADNISLQDLVCAAGLNATQLISLFKRGTGRTPYAYVVHRRVCEAVYKLRNSNDSICQIALDVGFYDQQQMTHAFKRHLGCTPKSFRY